MKTLGLIGGTSWVSTIDYYRLINQMVNERLGGLNSARLLLYSLNFEDFKPPNDPLLWGETTRSLIQISNHLIAAGAECMVLCANTPHMAADEIEKSISVPVIHIAVATALAVKNANIKNVGLIGTKITMEQRFFTDKLMDAGINSLLPDTADRDFIHETIFSELTRNIFREETKERYIAIIDKLKNQGAEAVIFACTEIPLLIKTSESPLPFFDTTRLHAEAAVNFALE